MRKVLLLNDTTNWYHFGCTGTSTALKAGILKRGFDLTSLPITLTYKIHNHPQTKEDFQDYDEFLKFQSQNQEFIDQIKKHDIVMINGEGTIHGLREGPRLLLYLAFISKIFLKKHVEIINHSAYPQDDLSISNSQIIQLYKLVYSKLDFIAVREPLSFKLMQKLGLNVCESFDCLPLYIRDNYVSKKQFSKKTLLIAGSAAWLNLNILSKAKGNVHTFDKALENFAQYLNYMDKRGYEIQFIYGANDYPAKDDKDFIDFIEPKLGFKLNVVTANDIQQWLNIIEQASLLISGRFHHSIAAYCLGTPLVALNSNTPKMEGLMQVLGGREVIKYADPNLVDKLISATTSIERLGKNKTPNFEALITAAEKNFDGLDNI